MKVNLTHLQCGSWYMMHSLLIMHHVSWARQLMFRNCPSWDQREISIHDPYILITSWWRVWIWRYLKGLKSARLYKLFLKRYPGGDLTLNFISIKIKNTKHGHVVVKDQVIITNTSKNELYSYYNRKRSKIYSPSMHSTEVYHHHFLNIWICVLVTHDVASIKRNFWGSIIW